MFMQNGNLPEKAWSKKIGDLAPEWNQMNLTPLLENVRLLVYLLACVQEGL